MDEWAGGVQVSRALGQGSEGLMGHGCVYKWDV